MTELPGFYRGDDHTYLMTFRNRDTQELIDITGWLITSTIKLSSEMPDSEGIQSRYLADADTLPSMEGKAVLHFTSDQTRNLIPTRYQIDFQKIESGLTQTLFTGYLTVKADVTRGVGT